MYKIWDRKSFEVGGHCPLWWGWKNRMTTQNRQKIKMLYYKWVKNSSIDKHQASLLISQFNDTTHRYRMFHELSLYINYLLLNECMILIFRAL